MLTIPIRTLLKITSIIVTGYERTDTLEVSNTFPAV